MIHSKRLAIVSIVAALAGLLSTMPARAADLAWSMSFGSYGGGLTLGVPGLSVAIVSPTPPVVVYPSHAAFPTFLHAPRQVVPVVQVVRQPYRSHYRHQHWARKHKRHSHRHHY